MRTLIFFLLGVFVSGCVTGHMPEAQNNSRAHIIENIPFYPQEDYQCGPASLAAVLNYLGVPDTPGQVAGEIYSRSARGTLGVDMVLYAKSKGLDVSWYSGGLKDLRQNIDAGQPVIVLVDKGVSLFQANHFMVVIGYNEGGFIVNSGREERKFAALKDFLREWEKTRFQTLLIKKTSEK